jgi:hypothetical protein
MMGVMVGIGEGAVGSVVGDSLVMGEKFVLLIMATIIGTMAAINATHIAKSILFLDGMMFFFRDRFLDIDPLEDQLRDCICSKS